MRALMVEFDDDNEDEVQDEEDQASMDGMGRFVQRGERPGRGFRRDPRWRDEVTET